MGVEKAEHQVVGIQLHLEESLQKEQKRVQISQLINILFAQDTLERKVEGKWRDLLGKVPS